MQQRFDHEEAEEILAHAVRRQAEQGGFLLPGEDASARPGAISQEQLARMAAELGVSQEALVAAEREWRAQRLDKAERREFDRHVRGKWLSHLTSYAITNGFLMLINLLTEGHVSWALFPLIGWGIGLAFDTVGTFNRSDDDYQRAFAKWRKKRREGSEEP